MTGRGVTRPTYRRLIARPVRFEFAGARDHVTSRGDARKDIFLHDKNRREFLAVVSEVCACLTGWCMGGTGDGSTLPALPVIPARFPAPRD